MDAFFIVLFCVLLLALWRSGVNAKGVLRNQIDELEGEIGSLRELIRSLQRQLHALQNPAPAQPASAPIQQPAVAQQQPSPPARAAHAPALAVAAFAPPAVPTPAAPAAIQPAPLPPTPPKSWAPVQSVSAPTPSEPEEESTSAARLFSLEERLGANWLNKLGIAILVLGVASFLAYKLQTWGPAGKVLCGYSVSLVLLGGGVWLERKELYRIFARAGIGGGWALAFFTTFALHHVPATHVLNSLGVDLVLMALVAAGMVLHSLRYRSQAVTGLAFLLGFATVLTSHLEADSGTLVFSLGASAVLAIALVVVTTLRHWTWLELAGLVAVYLTHLVWLNNVLPANHAEFAQFWPSTALILLYWAIFRAAYVLRTPLNAAEENQSSLTAVLNSTGVLGLLKVQSAHPEWAFWALAALGAIEMALAFKVRARRRQAFVVLSTIAVFLLVAAVPFKFHGVSWPVLWLVEAQVLAVAGLRLDEPVFRRLGLLAGVLTGGVLAFHDVLPLIDFRFSYPDPSRHASLTVGLALAAALYWIHAEVYPRRWPRIAADEREALALRVTSWLAVAAATTALWVALPDLWLPVGWLALVLLMGLAARRFAARQVGLQADVLALVAGAVLLFHHVAPLASFRFSQADPSHHLAETAVLALAALGCWLYSEIFPRILTVPELDWDVWTHFLLVTISTLAAFLTAATLWVVLPATWVVVGWLLLALTLGQAADRRKIHHLAVQADLLAALAWVGFLPWVLWNADTGWQHWTPQVAAVALFYTATFRKTLAFGERRYVAPAYSWAATLLLALVAVDQCSVLSLGVVWLALGLALFEVGRYFRLSFLRWQGYFLVALAFLRYLTYNLPDTFDDFRRLQQAEMHAPGFSATRSLLLEVLTLAAAGWWLMERTRNAERTASREHIAGLAFNGLGTLGIALWFAYQFPSYWVPAPGGETWVTAIWAGMAALLLALAWLLRRRVFLVQALALTAAVLARAFALDLMADAPAGFWNAPLTHLSLAALILLAALPFAYRLRAEDRFGPAVFELNAEFAVVLHRPEQVSFFAPFALMVVALAAKLSSGHITIAWSLLGLGVFLFALTVGERSFRLAGLGLLLVSVVKIMAMDVWKLSLSERFPVLIVLGLALVAVSFLYTRFSAAIRKFL